MRDGRVILVSDYGADGGVETGGAGYVVRDSLAALTARGVDARLIYGFGAASVPGATGLGGTDLRAAGVRGAVRAIYHRQARDALHDALANADRATTIVILHQWTRYLSPAAIGVLADFPLMVHLHDHFWMCPNGAYFDFPAGRPCWRRPLGIRCVAAQCDRQGRATKIGRLARHVALAAVTRREGAGRVMLHLSRRAEELAAPLLPNERHAILHNPLDIAETPPPPPLSQCYDVGYFGRLEPEKGLVPLIEALVANNRTALFVGDGTLADAIGRHPQLELRRWQPRETMAAAMRSCRIVVLPSLWLETWGLIVPEAMAAGVPVLVSDRAGSAELVERFGGGAIFDPATPGALAGAIERMLAAPPATPVADWAGFRTMLSAESHAARIVALAAERFGINLAPPSRVRAAVTTPAPAPGRRLAR